MTTETLAGARVATQANVYFDGKCVSHTLTLADGTKKSVGVVLPSELTFKHRRRRNHGMRGRFGCEYRLAGSDRWQSSGPGQKFSVPANSSFDIRVTQAYHYICHFG